MAQTRYYSSTAQPTTLTAPISNSDVNIVVQATTGFPPAFPYILALDYGNPGEELVLVTNGAGLNLTVTRAYDGTSGTTHGAGAPVRHVVAGIDLTEANVHENAVSAAHGVAGTIVGTTDVQTLTSKTLSAPVINGGSLNGTVSGNPTFSGTVTLTSPTINGTVGGTPTLNGATENNPNITGVVTGKATYRTITGQPAIDADQCIVLKRISATQTGNIMSMQDETGASLGFISPSGAARWRSGLNGGAGDSFSVSSTGVGTWTIQSAANKGLSIKAAAAQSVNLQDWQNSSSTVLASVDSAGIIHALSGLKAGSADQFSVDTSGNVTATNIPSGAWTSYTPTWTTTTGANVPSLGNAVTNCAWSRVGKTVFVRFQVSFGSTTNFGGGTSADNWRWGLPVQAAASMVTGSPLGMLSLNQGAPNNCMGSALIDTNLTFNVLLSSAAVSGTPATSSGFIDSASPWTWANGNNLVGVFTYESI